MKKYSQYITAILLIALIAGCKSYAKITIDDHAIVKIDSGLLGTWKAIEDTDKKNFILVQSSYDNFHQLVRWHDMDSSERRKYRTDRYPNDTALLNYFFQENDANFNGSYDKFIKENNCNYYITYFDGHGKNPHYQQFTNFLSKINNVTFLNSLYHYTPYVNGHYISEESTEGYFFIRLISINATYDTITTAILADTTLKSLKTSQQVRERITKNLNNPSFYSDTLHFYKVNNYHLSLNQAVLKAN